jgi:hypothetical protein
LYFQNRKEDEDITPHAIEPMYNTIVYEPVFEPMYFEPYLK